MWDLGTHHVEGAGQRAVCQPRSAAMAGESARIMVNPTQDSQSLKRSPSFPPTSRTEAWSPKSTQRDGRVGTPG